MILLMLKMLLLTVMYLGMGVIALIQVLKYEKEQVVIGPRFLLIWIMWPVAVFCAIARLVMDDLPMWINRRVTTTDESNRTKPA